MEGEDTLFGSPKPGPSCSKLKMLLAKEALCLKVNEFTVMLFHNFYKGKRFPVTFCLLPMVTYSFQNWVYSSRVYCTHDLTDHIQTAVMLELLLKKRTAMFDKS